MKIEIFGKPQTIGYMAVYNEVEYVEYSIRSVIEHVNTLIVVEGAFEETVRAGGSLRSDDGTLEILEKLQQEFSWQKLVIYKAPFPADQLRHRNMFFDLVGFHCPLATNMKYYWLWLIDADEVYDEDNISALKDVLNSTNSDCIKIDSLTFVNNFHSYVKIGFPRCFRIRSGRKHVFMGANHVACLNDKWQPTRVLNDGEENHEDSVRFFHYSYVKDPARFSLKKKERELVHGANSFKWSLDSNNQVVCPGTNIRTFSGEHPPVMHDHPRFK